MGDGRPDRTRVAPPSGALAREFFARPTVDVARALVGAHLVCDPGTPDQVEAVLVEVEAYLGLDDPASHAHRGPVGRAAIMFGRPGHLYVYLAYGMHLCANVVCEPAEIAGAVLLRAARVVSGEAVVRRRRSAPGRDRRRDGTRALATDALLRGPGNLGRGLGLSLADNGADLCAPAGRLRILPRVSPPPLQVSTRVGISRAADRPLRFAWAGDPAVSNGPRAAAPSPRGRRRDDPG
jgi:DNA-3-methyladenine glycosylase